MQDMQGVVTNAHGKNAAVSDVTRSCAIFMLWPQSEVFNVVGVTDDIIMLAYSTLLKRARSIDMIMPFG